ncbi:MAG TPA: hypothetical protein VMD30_10530 [Tepidisphaeraceae bacterium]|nr:hypothetical protein [Tepidisphaeraceae bacterium]
MGGMLVDYMGPHGAKLWTNHALIEDITSDSDPYWIFAELTRRLCNGRLSKQEAAAAVDQMAVRKEKDRMLITWRDAIRFFATADDCGAITTGQYAHVAQVFLGGLSLRTPSTMAVNTPEAVDVRMGATFFTENLAIAIRDASLCRSGQRPAKPWQGVTKPDDLRYVTGLYEATAWISPRVPPGDYDLRVVVDIGILRGEPTSSYPGQAASWPLPRAKWTQIFTVPVQVTPAVVFQPGTQWPPVHSFRLETDPGFDPQKAHAITIVSVQADCYTDETVIVVWARAHNLPVACCFDVFFRIGGVEDPGGSNPTFLTRGELVPGWDCELPRLAPNERTIDLVLRPDLHWGKLSGLDAIWGKTVTFAGLPFTRHNYDFSLKKWRQRQAAREAAHMKSKTRPS